MIIEVDFKNDNKNTYGEHIGRLSYDVLISSSVLNGVVLWVANIESIGVMATGTTINEALIECSKIIHSPFFNDVL